MNMQTLTTEEQERAAYMAGDTRAADLLARIAELEAQVLELQDKLDDMGTEAQRTQDAQDLGHLREFFHDCFRHLAGVYPCPSYSSDYDKNVIFEAIEKGEAQ